MIDVSSARVVRCIVHRVGNRVREEGYSLSDGEVHGTSELHGTMLRHYLAPMVKTTEAFQFFHESDLELNAVRHFSNRIFENQKDFPNQSKAIAKHLYASSNHPQISGGEVIIILYRDLKVEGDSRFAIGIYRIEERQSYLDVIENSQGLDLVELSGISLSTIQKGALLFDDGSTVFAKDSSTQQAKYWTDAFLKIRPLQTSNSSAKLATSLITEVGSKLDSDATVSFRKEIKALIEEGADLTFGILKNTTEKYLSTDAIQQIAHQLEERSGFSISDNYSLDTDLLARQTRSFTRNIPLGDGLGLVISNPQARIERCTTQRSKNKVRLTIDLEIKGE